MKLRLQQRQFGRGLAVTISGFALIWSAGAAEPDHQDLTTNLKATSDENAHKTQQQLVIQQIEAAEPDRSGKESPWLGLSTEETSEVLAAQLGLNAGEGLTVTYVAPDSPAAKAGLQKNDVLVEFDGQLLVLPAQLRKLIRLHKEGDTLKLVYYRSGKKETASATVGKTSGRERLWQDETSLRGDLRELHQRLSNMHLGEAAREQLQTLRQSLDAAGVDRESVHRELQRSMEEVRKALQEAMRQVTNAHRTFGPAAREFRELVRRGVDVDKDATVIVKSRKNSVQSMVKTDESGTYVIVADPKRRLTAHDKSGKLLFDGMIETQDEQDKVPREVWEKVKPMLEQLQQDKSDKEPSEPEKEGS